MEKFLDGYLTREVKETKKPGAVTECPQQEHMQKGEQFSVSLSWSEWSVVAKVDCPEL